MAVMKELIIPNIELKDELILENSFVSQSPSGVVSKEVPFKVKIAEVDHSFCAISELTGKAVGINGEYTFTSTHELVLALSRKYQIYQED